MKNKFLLLIVFLGCWSFYATAQVHTTYLWHMDQPIYWGEKSQSNPNACQYVKESQDIKTAGGNKYSDGVSHPLNDLYDIFGKADRVAAYQWEPKTAIGMLSDLSNAGAQVSYSGDLMENVNSLGHANQWGYGPNWAQPYKDAMAWKTSGGFPKLDMIGFSKDHAFSPLISYRTLRKSIAAHRYLVQKYYGVTNYSKGYWPAECAFSERIIKALVDEGIEWSVIANGHLARTLNDYPNTTGTNCVNSEFPNPADKVATNGVNWWSGQIDGRGGSFAAPYCYTPHKAKYVDPNNGTEYKIDVVPMCDLLSYRDGYSQQGTGDIEAHIAPFITDAAHPPLVLLAHDGDNAWGGGASYYEQAVTGFSHEAKNKGYEPTVIQQYLNDHPVAATDVVHVEDGAWVNADSDWGHPQLINWLWPLYNKTTNRFDPNAWTEDARNWAVITAVDNYVEMAEDLAGGVNIGKCTQPDGTASDAEKAWHFYFTTLNSGYMYYGKALDMEVKQTVGGNLAVSYAQNVINAHTGVDNTAPSIFVPQRFPYNPGAQSFGPMFAYKVTQMPSDFDVWTFVHDVSNVSSVVLKYRTDKDGKNLLTDNDNDTYAGGAGVNTWQSVTMTKKVMDKTNITNDPEIDFFMLPTAIADMYYAPVTGLTDVLVDYYVEATDSKGNVAKSDIQHVWVAKAPTFKVTGVTISPNATQLMPGNTQQLTATIAPTSATNKAVTYASSNTAVATVSATGLVTAVALGNATITVTTDDGSFTDVCTVTVSNTPPPGFTVYFQKPANWGTPVKIYYWNTLPAGSMPTVVWSGVAMTDMGNGWYSFRFNNVSSTSLIFNAGSNQTGDLTRSSDGWYSNNVWYNAEPTKVTSVSVSPTTATVSIGATQQLTATVLPATAINKAVTWSSSSSAIATVNSTGLVTAVATGAATITVTTVDGSKTATSAITVNPVGNNNPTSANTTVSTGMNINYVFKANDIVFNGLNGATFSGVKLLTLPTVGTLEYNGAVVTVNTDYADVTKFVFKPVASGLGSAYSSFTFKVKDNTGAYSDTYTFTFDVLKSNPTSADATVLTVLNYTFKLSDFTFNGLYGTTFVGVKLVTLPSTGTLEYNGTTATLNMDCPDVTKLVFKPVVGGSGSPYTTFTFNVKASHGVYSESANTMTINVVKSNPTSADASVTTGVNLNYTFKSSDFAFNGMNGATFASIRLSSLPTAGSLEYSGGMAITGVDYVDVTKLVFKPASGGSGSPYTTFKFTVKDNNGVISENAYTMTVNVAKTNPTSANTSVTTTTNVNYTFKLADFPFNGSNGATFVAVKLVSLPTTGTLQYNGNPASINVNYIDVTKLVFKPVTGMNGTPYASFSFYVQDNNEVYSEIAYSMTINVSKSNPTSANVTVSTNQSVNYTFKSADFTFNGVSGATFAAVKLATLPTVGTLQYNGANATTGVDYTDVTKLVFKPVAGATGTPYATFAFIVKDNNGVYSENSYTLTINVLKATPTSANATISTNQNVNYTFKTTDFTFIGQNGATFAAFKLATLPTAGTLQYNGATANVGVDYADATLLVFRPSANVYGSPYTTFLFYVKDNIGVYSENPNTITVNVLKTSPTSASASVTTNQDENYTFKVSDFPFTGVNGATFAGVKFATLPSTGSLEYNGAVAGITTEYTDMSKLVFRPTPASYGTPYTTFDFYVKDNTGLYSENSYTMTVNVIKTSPTSENMVVTIDQDVNKAFSVTDFAFASPVGATFAGIKIIAAPTAGTLKINTLVVTANTECANVSQLIFVPAAGASSTPYTTFTFKVKDSNGKYSDAIYTVTINVNKSTGFSENENSTEFTIYPNPSKGIFNIQTTLTSKFYDLKIVNLAGETILDKTNLKSSNNVIDLSNYPKGLYLVRIKMGETIINKKITIQ